MSKKAERVKRSFAKQWFAVISGSMFVMSTQAAQASQGQHGFNAHQLRHSGERLQGLQNRVHNQSVQSLNGDVIRLNNGVNLDLSNSAASITLGNNLFNHVDSVSISVGGESRTLGAGAQVTAAEYVAVKQVLGGNAQSITVDGAGRATGGQFDLNSISASNDTMRASSLVIPENVSAAGQFGRGSEFRLVGNLDNYGSLVASSNSRRGSTLHADDISNHAGASISSVKNDLNLIADGTLTNDGSISSAGSVSLLAGSNFSNSGSIQARNSVSINAAGISNSGTISATNGDITLDGPTTAVLTINNAGGQLAALNGAINMRGSDYNGSFDTFLNGGDVLSKSLNINAGNAFGNVSVDDLTGEINQKGLGAHVLASTDVLNIGEVCLTGDPTFYNTAGSINISANVTVAEALTVIASGDITSANGITITAANAAQGFPINLIAGANIVFTNGGANVTAIPPLVNNGDVATVNGNVFGGSILLGQNVTISTRSTAGVNTNGADVIMDAFAGIANGSGRILLPLNTINTGGRGTGNNGNVTMIAGITGNTNAISAGIINTTGGTGSGGSVSLNAVQPVVSSGASGVGFFANGSNTGVGTYVAGVNAAQTGNIDLQGNITAAGTVILNAGNSIGVAQNVSAQGLLLAFAHGNFTQFNSSQITVANGAAILGMNIDGNIIGNANTLIAAPNMLLISNNGKIGVNAGSRLRIDADQLQLSAVSGSAFLKDIDALTFSNVNPTTVGGTLDVQSVDNMDVAGVISGDIVKLSGDAISINADINGGTSVTVNAGTDILGGAGRISGSNVFLTAASADLGSIANPVLTNADNLVANALFSSLFIQELDSVNLGGGSSGSLNTFSVKAGGTLSTSSLVSSKDVVLTGTTLGITGQVIGSNSVTLTGSASLQNGNVTGSVSAPTVVLNSTGDIGTTLAPFKVNGASSVQASVVSANSTNQSVFVQGADGTVFGDSSALSKLFLSSTGGLTVAGDLIANTNNNGTISVTAAKGTLRIENGVNILSRDDINILNSGTSKSTDKLSIGDNVTIATDTTVSGDGNISMVLGAATGKAKTKVKNVNVVLQGGTVQFLNKGLTAVASTPTTTFTAKTANIVTGNSVNVKNFTLGKSVVVTADPPPPAGTPIIYIYGDGSHNHSDSNEVVTALQLESPVQSAATSLQVSAGQAISGSVEFSSPNFNTLASLPATMSFVPVNNDVNFDDSSMVTGTSSNGAAGAKLLSHKQFGSDEAFVATSDGSIAPNKFNLAADEVINDVHTMDNGSAVVVATKDTTVVSPNGSVKLAAGTIAFITSNNAQLSVYDIDDRHKGSVVVETAGKQISLSPGRHVTVTTLSADQFGDVNPVETIAHRSVSRQTLNANSTAFHSEFSLPSAISAINPLLTIVRSNSSEAKKIRERLMKTTAVLMQIGGGAPYAVHARTKMVAFNR